MKSIGKVTHRQRFKEYNDLLFELRDMIRSKIPVLVTCDTENQIEKLKKDLLEDFEIDCKEEDVIFVVKNG